MANIMTRDIRTINGVKGMFYGIEADTYEEAQALIARLLPEDVERLKEEYTNDLQEALGEALLADWSNWE